MKRATASRLQLVAIIGACGLLGYSLSRFPGAAIMPWWLPTTVGAAIGVLAIVLGPLFSGFARHTEQDSSPKRILGFKLMLLGFAIGASGFLVVVLANPAMGRAMFFVGWVLVVAGIVLSRQKANHVA
jgi:hypothetical protein